MREEILKMRKILVTGGTVFVSRFVADYFAQKGDDVYEYSYHPFCWL